MHISDLKGSSGSQCLKGFLSLGKVLSRLKQPRTCENQFLSYFLPAAPPPYLIE